MPEKKEYDTKLDSKNRLTIRSARTRYYNVTEYEDGTVKLSPRELIHPDEISHRTLQMMDEALNKMQDKANEAIDMEALRQLLNRE
jgi:hypothetical protein